MPASEKTLKRVLTISQERFGISDGVLDYDKPLSSDDIGFDMLDLMDMISAIEEELQVEGVAELLSYPAADEIGQINVRQVAEAVEEQLRRKGRARKRRR